MKEKLIPSILTLHLSKSNKECEHNDDSYANTPKIKVAAITNDMAVSIHRMDYGCQLRHVFGQ